jgi:hypothetical protein
MCLKMRIIFKLFIIIGLLSITVDLYTQNNYEIKELEALLAKRINEFRQDQDLDLLWNDSLLYQSASEHIEYLAENNELSIFESSRRDGTPQKRAERHGAEDYYVAEILSCFKINDLQNKDSLAAHLFNNHIKTTRNKAYLRSKMFKIHAIKIKALKGDSILIVHELAVPGSSYEYKKNKEIFPYDETEAPIKKKPLKFIKKYEHKLKAPKKEEDCADVLDTYNRLRNISLLDIDNNMKLILDKESSAKQMISGKKDGIAVEIIDPNEYLCDSEEYYMQNKRNGRSEINGSIKKVKYRDDIFSDSGYRDEKEDFFSVNLGSAYDDQREINAIILKKKKVCKIIHQQKLCGEPLSYNLEELPYIDNLYKAEYHPNVEYDTLKLKIYYKPNQTEPDMKEVEKILDFVQKEGLVISRAYVNANASIEGSKDINERIFNQRADHLIDLFEAKQAYSIRRKIKMQENWDLFYKQIKNTKFSYLEFEDTSVARYLVNDSLEYFSNLLDEQRYAVVNLFAVTKATRDQFKVYAMNDFNENILNITDAYDAGKSDVYDRLIEESGKIQLFIYDLYTRGEISDDFLRMMKIPKDPEFVDLHFYKLMFDFRYIDKTKRISESKFFDRIEKLIKQKNAGALEYYNFLAYIINHYGEEEVMDYHKSKKIKGLIAKSKNDLVSNSEYDKMNFHYNYLKAEECFENGEFKKAPSALKAIYDYYLESDADTSSLVNLAKYYIQFHEVDGAFKIVEKLFNKHVKNKELIALYLKLHFKDYWVEERSSDYYYLIEEMYDQMSREDWIEMFTGKCNISIQLFDYEPLRQMYYCID